MEGMDLILTPAIVRRCLGPLTMFGLYALADTFWTHRYVVQTVPTKGLTFLLLPTLPHHTPHPSLTSPITHSIPLPPPPPSTPFIYMPLMILQWL